MLTLFEPSTALASPESATTPTDGPSWRLTQAMHLLRLTVADASLRAREEAQHFSRTSIDHWAAMGRAHGYHEAVLVLRTWTHPEQHDAVLTYLDQHARSAMVRRERANLALSNPLTTRAFHGARAWALRWVMTQVGELAAHANSLS